MNTRRTIPLVLASLLVLSAAACGGDDDDASSDATTAASGDTVDAAGLGPIVVGSADFPESQLIAQIYGQALATAGFDVSYELAIGAREVYYDAIQSGEVDLVPEYTNSLLSFVVRQDDPAALPTATNVDEQITELGEVLPDGLEVLPPSTAEDKDVIVCTKEVADKYSLTNLSELGAVAPDITIGGPPEFETRAPFGLVGFKDIYGAEFGDFVPLDDRCRRRCARGRPDRLRQPVLDDVGHHDRCVRLAGGRQGHRAQRGRAAAGPHRGGQ